MISETNGLVLRQVKTINGRRILRLFTEKHGKVSVGVRFNERGRSKTILPIKAFTYASYELYISRGYYSYNKGQVIKSFYKIGEDVDRYMAASYGLELCDRVLEEEVPAPEIFRLTVDFLATMEERKARFETLLLFYKIKLLSLLGMAPVTDRCACCGREVPLTVFSIPDGGLVCENCLSGGENRPYDPLRYPLDFDIVSVLGHIQKNAIKDLKNLALEEPIETKINTIIDQFITYHLDPGDLKSGSLRMETREE